MQQPPMEKRIAARYRLCLPVLFSWTDSTGATQKAGGFTRDIGIRGLYVFSEICPPLHAAAVVEVRLPLRSPNSFHSARLTATVQVIRISDLIDGGGFAATGELNQFQHMNMKPLYVSANT